MNLSVIIPVFNGEETLATSLESLVSQTTEDFEVIVVDDGSTDETEKVAREYCDNYVDFFYLKQEHKGVYAARNFGVKNSKGKYVIFLDCGDFFSEDSVEQLMKTVDETSADIIFGRCYRFGDIEYEYDTDIDSVVVRKKISRLETGLCRMHELGCTALHRKFFEVNEIFFDETFSAYGEWPFMMKCIMASKKMTGSPYFIMEKSIEFITHPESEFKQPTMENLKSLCRCIDEVYDIGKTELAAELGEVDGDEAFLQDILRCGLELLLDDFYRKLWRMDNETLELLGTEFRKYGEFASKSMLKQFVEKNKDMRIPFMYSSLEHASTEPLFTIILDLPEPEIEMFLRSLYAQDYPFFELFVRRSDFELLTDEFKNMKNIVVLDDKTFHYDAHKTARSKNRFQIKNGKPLDKRVMRETCLATIPQFLVSFVFNQKRGQLGMRKDLKDKGLIMRDREEK